MSVYTVWLSNRPQAVRWVMVLLSLGIVTISFPSLPAQAGEPTQPEETTVRKVSPTSFGTLPPAAVVLPGVPLAFTKAVPESIDDLREMESHIQTLVATLTETTVALTIGNAQGSGVIVHEDGIVLTAAHVSGPPGQPVTILLSNGKRATGYSLGCNRTLDASLIRIDSPQQTWPSAPIAKIDEVQVGDWSIVMGHPGGHQAGRLPVFRLGRVIEADNRAIQTDNELVGGDSGGPLFDIHGRVIGINSRIGPQTSLNLHTPINAYTDDWERLVAGEDFSLHSGALLGVSGERVDGGLKLTKVWPGDPAERAGLRVGDILLQYNSRPVRSFERLRELVGEDQPGSRVVLAVRRANENIEVTVRLGRKHDSTGQ